MRNLWAGIDSVADRVRHVRLHVESSEGWTFTGVHENGVLWTAKRSGRPNIRLAAAGGEQLLELLRAFLKLQVQVEACPGWKLISPVRHPSFRWWARKGFGSSVHEVGDVDPHVLVRQVRMRANMDPDTGKALEPDPVPASGKAK